MLYCISGSWGEELCPLRKPQGGLAGPTLFVEIMFFRCISSLLSLMAVELTNSLLDCVY